MKVKWDDYSQYMRYIKAMFQTTNQVADFPLIKNPVETTDFHAEIRSFDGKSPHVCIGRHLTHV
jgi:hypothetical protein